MSRLTHLIRKLRGTDKPRYPKHVSVGRGSYVVGPNAFWHLDAEGAVTIGQFCSIAADVAFVCSAGNHRMDTASTSSIAGWMGEHRPHGMHKGPIIVGNDVWIGQRAMIMGGVTIGNGAVIGAGSVVARDVEPYAVYVGNPARLVKSRFDQATIDALLQIAWWDWPDEKIRAEKEYFHTLSGQDFAARHAQSYVRQNLTRV